MPETIPFETFMLDVPPQNMEFVQNLHAFMLEKGCDVKIASAKSGYVLSYLAGSPKRTVMNYVFRKAGFMVRLYGDNYRQYLPLLERMPEKVRKSVLKSPKCRRLLDPSQCNQRCPMGYVVELDGEEHKKCRYSCFLFLVEEQSEPFIMEMLESELAQRA